MKHKRFDTNLAFIRKLDSQVDRTVREAEGFLKQHPYLPWSVRWAKIDKSARIVFSRRQMTSEVRRYNEEDIKHFKQQNPDAAETYKEVRQVSQLKVIVDGRATLHSSYEEFVGRNKRAKYCERKIPIGDRSAFLQFLIEAGCYSATDVAAFVSAEVAGEI